MEDAKEKLPILSADFSMEVERLVRKTGTTYLEAIAELCEQHGIDESKIKPLLSKSLVEKIKLQASGLRLLKKEHREKEQNIFL